MEATTRKISQNYNLVELAELMENIRDGLNALGMMTDAFLLGPESYNEDATANAMHLVIETTLEKAETVEKKLKAALYSAITA